MKLLPKLRKDLASYSPEYHICPHISVLFQFNLHWKIHKFVAHWVRPSLVHSLFPVTTRINFRLPHQINYLIIDHVNALATGIVGGTVSPSC